MWKLIELKHLSNPRLSDLLSYVSKIYIPAPNAGPARTVGLAHLTGGRCLHHSPDSTFLCAKAIPFLLDLPSIQSGQTSGTHRTAQSPTVSQYSTSCSTYRLYLLTLSVSWLSWVWLSLHEPLSTRLSLSQLCMNWLKKLQCSAVFIIPSASIKFSVHRHFT